MNVCHPLISRPLQLITITVITIYISPVVDLRIRRPPAVVNHVLDQHRGAGDGDGGNDAEGGAESHGLEDEELVMVGG